ncbi:hypothetical protein BDZ45DRAFT_801766 [Acephala macrosclerotiorum]|nr:hypothetical protein BDZ45DRAFT_801766 [Acephala macrosclerotiorum]
MTDKHTLRFSNPPQSSSPHVNVNLPENITRHFKPTPNGTLELISAGPSPSTSNSRPRKKTLFQHGGFGSAFVFLPFISYFSSHSYPCYALSLCGHGASYSPSFLSLVYLTTKHTTTSDLSSRIAFIRSHESQFRNQPLEDSDLVLVKHSAGGGLAQYYLSQAMGKIRALFFHPRSPLSSTELVKGAFFPEGKGVEKVCGFEEVVRNIVGWGAEGDEEKGEGMGIRVLIVAGGEDKLMGVELIRRMAGEYRVEAGKMLKGEAGEETGVGLWLLRGVDIIFRMIFSGRVVRGDFGVLGPALKTADFE